MTCEFVESEDDIGDFNSHAHVERDESHDDLHYRNNISTHTLTWSVTIHHQKKDQQEKISTHTLTWSVTVYG